MSERPTHRVSCKAAIYSPNSEEILLMYYPSLGADAHGLPGGHLEHKADGTPDSPEKTILRELKEEAGAITLVGALKPKDFWVADGKIVLAYVGQATSTELSPPAHGDFVEIPRWIPLVDIAAGTVDTGSYKSFILTNQPEAA